MLNVNQRSGIQSSPLPDLDHIFPPRATRMRSLGFGLMEDNVDVEPQYASGEGI